MNSAVRAKLVKLEARGLFTQVLAEMAKGRWWYFREAPRAGLALRQQQSISAYRCFLYLSYHLCGIPCELYLEREVQVGQPEDDLWQLSFNLEGKEKETQLLDLLTRKPDQGPSLTEQGFRISTGSENLDRQMNFSLGLYGAALVHVDVHFPTQELPYTAFCQLMDQLERLNEQTGLLPLTDATLSDYDFDDGVIFGDWQTWK